MYPFPSSTVLFTDQNVLSWKNASVKTAIAKNATVKTARKAIAPVKAANATATNAIAAKKISAKRSADVAGLFLTLSDVNAGDMDQVW